LLLQALYPVRSERLLIDQLDYNLLFRWFVGLNMTDSAWAVTVVTKNRERLLDGDIAEAFFQAVHQQAGERSLRSDEHFTVDGTLLEAWASVKSYQRKDAKNAIPPDDPGNATLDFHGEKRSNQTHASKTDPDAKMARKGKGKEAKLSYNGNLLVENRNGLIVSTELFEANGTAERDAALVMLEQIPGTKQVNVGGDKAYDATDFVAECRNLRVTPHVTQNLERRGGSAIDARTTQHPGYANLARFIRARAKTRYKNARWRLSQMQVQQTDYNRHPLIGEAALLRPIPSRRHVEVSLARRHRLVHETGPKNGRSYQPVRSAGKRRAVQVIGDSRGRGLPLQAD